MCIRDRSFGCSFLLNQSTASSTEFRVATNCKSEKLFNNLSSFLAAGFSSSIITTPVSYTHLDVYKRQELLSSDFQSDERLGHFQDEKLHPQESWFKMMLRYNYFQKEREDRIKNLHHQIKLYVLEKDEVAPPIEALNTLQGGYRNIKTEVEIQDFPYEYSHMVPFPLTNKIQKEVTEAFQHFVNSASAFYNG